MANNISSLANKFSSFETTWNYVEYTIPLPQIRAIRLLFGVAQIAAGVAYAIFRVIHSIFDGQLKTLMRWKEVQYLFVHGALNAARGIFGLFPMAHGIIGIVGSTFGLLLFDAFIGRFNYWKEKMAYGVFPINNPETWKQMKELSQRFQKWIESAPEVPLPDEMDLEVDV